MRCAWARRVPFTWRRPAGARLALHCPAAASTCTFPAMAYGGMGASICAREEHLRAMDLEVRDRLLPCSGGDPFDQCQRALCIEMRIALGVDRDDAVGI